LADIFFDMEFRCKEFELNHSHSTMKVGTDAILLSALTPNIKAERILDIGTGCGIVALCMAQKYKNANVTAIDIDIESIAEAKANFLNSKFKNRLTSIQISLQKFAQTTNEIFDLIVSNPPFFSDSLLSDNTKRNIARHNICLMSEDLISYSVNMLSANGIIVLILPNAETENLLLISHKYNLFCKEQYHIFDKKDKPCKRVTSIFAKTNSKNKMIKSNLILRNQDNTYTETYFNLIYKYLI